MADVGALMNATEVAAYLGLSRANFYRLRAERRFEFLKTSRPVGQRIYSRALVEQYAQGGMMARFGRRTA